MKTNERLMDKVKWDANGLVACVVQDDATSEVLMVAYMNRVSLGKTLKGRKACFWSRSRQKLWLKGEESGNFQSVKKVFIDCDGDCLLVRVKQIGGAACHTGMRSCFYRQSSNSGVLKVTGKKVFDPKKVYHK